RRDARVLDADLALAAAELERLAAERAARLARRGADDAVEADLPGVTALEAVVAAARVRADGRAREVLDALLAFAAALAPAAALLGQAAHEAGVGLGPAVGRDLAHAVPADLPGATLGRARARPPHRGRGAVAAGGEESEGG